jgi:NAD(P)-dependent dehydrogenase (short-subunit alcohol dehydrogenase family)
MEYLVTMTTHVPEGTPDQAVGDIRGREAARSRELADDRAGHAAHPAPERPGADVMTGKVAVITGGSQGIGAGLVAGYRRQGWAVVANALTIKPSEEPDLVTVAGDIADPATADLIADAALERFGRIDTLVNNAGVYVSKPFTDYTAEDYALVTGVNLTGFFWLTRRVIAEMARRYGGHVVNISATLAEVADSRTPEVLAAMTKGGLAAATRSLAVEYASRGIRVNAVSPGIIQTPMHPAESYEGLGDRLPPLGRVGQVADVVDAILFLEASPYITGEILHVDGGQIAGH